MMLILHIAAVILSLIQIEAAFLRVYNSADECDVTPLEEPLNIGNSSCFDRSLRTIIYTFGFTAKVEGVYTKAVRNAYTNNVDANFILLDWEEEAKQGLLGYALGYATSGIPNAMKVGAQLGDAILQLKEESLIELSNLHLVAHSLGAHLMSYAADRLNETGNIVGRITGLDPAGPLYSTPPYYSGLRPYSATFVVGLHTDPGTYGTTKDVGHVDIWPNCGMRHQPGCANTINLPFGRADFCSHNRAPLIYSEALANTTAFPAIQAESCSDWRNNYDGQGDIIFIGENIDPGTRGKFYLKTNAEEPLGQGDAGLQP